MDRSKPREVTLEVTQETPEEASSTIQTSLHAAGVLPYGLQDVEQVRLVLQGDSVVDWRRLAFRDHEDAAAFLGLCGFDTRDAADLHRLATIKRRALEYLDTQLLVHVGPEVRDAADMRDVLLMASRDGATQRDACVVLKVMHVLHHVAGRELLYRLPVSTSELFHRVEQKVFDAMDGMKAQGIRIAEFAGSRKSHASILTKLLCRADSHATQVHDRLRFRLVPETLEDTLGALVYITRSLLPFNYVVPGESRNDLIDLIGTLQTDPRLRRVVPLLQELPGSASGARVNYFSAGGFRMINFVADMPVRVDDLVGKIEDFSPDFGRVVFLLVEFQLVDRQTSLRNESGENSHLLYKARQHAQVIQRLGAPGGGTTN